MNWLKKLFGRTLYCQICGGTRERYVRKPLKNKLAELGTFTICEVCNRHTDYAEHMSGYAKDDLYRCIGCNALFFSSARGLPYAVELGNTMCPACGHPFPTSRDVLIPRSEDGTRDAYIQFPDKELDAANVDFDNLVNSVPLHRALQRVVDEIILLKKPDADAAKSRYEIWIVASIHYRYQETFRVALGEVGGRSQIRSTFLDQVEGVPVRRHVFDKTPNPQDAIPAPERPELSVSPEEVHEGEYADVIDSVQRRKDGEETPELKEDLEELLSDLNRVAVAGDVNARAEHGRTALMSAARAGLADLVGFLLERGADVNAADVGDETALLGAMNRGTPGMVQLLIDKGAEVNVKGPIQVTPLIRAAALGRADLVNLLLQNNADIDAKDEFGDTALMTAVEEGHEEVAKILKENGAED